MEKFGIFNILSALGNLAEEKGETAKKEEESAPAPPAPAPAERAGIFTGEERMNKMLSVLERSWRTEALFSPFSSRTSFFLLRGGLW